MTAVLSTEKNCFIVPALAFDMAFNGIRIKEVPVYEVSVGGVNGGPKGRAMVGDPKVEGLDGFPHILLPTDVAPDHIDQV